MDLDGVGPDIHATSTRLHYKAKETGALLHLYVSIRAEGQLQDPAEDVGQPPQLLAVVGAD